MSKEFTKEDVIQNKKEAIKSLNILLEKFICDSSCKYLKKANLISFWLKEYVNLIEFEESFIPAKNIAYKRGNIVKLNFGFNIGSEYGGLHYGIVIDNNNHHNSPVLTVIPLTSTKKNDKPVHPNNVNLGNEIYRLLKLKFDTIQKSAKEELIEIKETLDSLKRLSIMSTKAIDEVKQTDAQSIDYENKCIVAENYIQASSKLISSFEQKQKHAEEEINYLSKIGEEISQMKEGSIALVNQITTVSKMRIYDPRNLKGVLAGVSLSPEYMDSINLKVKELYVFK